MSNGAPLESKTFPRLSYFMTNLIIMDYNVSFRIIRKNYEFSKRKLTICYVRASVKEKTTLRIEISFSIIFRSIFCLFCKLFILRISTVKPRDIT